MLILLIRMMLLQLDGVKACQGQIDHSRVLGVCGLLFPHHVFGATVSAIQGCSQGIALLLLFLWNASISSKFLLILSRDHASISR